MDLIFAVTGAHYHLNLKNQKKKTYKYEEISKCIVRYFKYERKDFRIFSHDGIWLMKKRTNISLDKPFFVYLHPKKSKKLELDLSAKTNFRTLIFNQLESINTALINYNVNKKGAVDDFERFFEEHVKELDHFRDLLDSSENDIQILETTPLPRFQNQEQTEGEKPPRRLFLIEKFSQNGVVLRNQIEELKESMKQYFESKKYHEDQLRKLKEDHPVKEVEALLKCPQNYEVGDDEEEVKKVWEKNVEISLKNLLLLSSAHRIINELLQYKRYFPTSTWKSSFLVLNELHNFHILVKSAQCERYRRFEAASVFSSSEKRRRKRFSEWTQKVLQFEPSVIGQLFPDLDPSEDINPDDEEETVHSTSDSRLLNRFSDLGWTEQSQDRFIMEMNRFDRKKSTPRKDVEEEEEEEDEGEEDEDKEVKSPISPTNLQTSRERKAFRRVQDLERQCRIFSGQIRKLNEESRSVKRKKDLEIAHLENKLKECEAELAERRKEKTDKIGELNRLISASFGASSSGGSERGEEEEDEEENELKEKLRELEEKSEELKSKFEKCKLDHVNEMQRVMKEKLDLEEDNEKLKKELKETEMNCQLILEEKYKN